MAVLRYLTCSAVLGLTCLSAFAADDPADPEVLVWRKVRNDFHSLDVKPEFIAELVDKTPPASVEIRKGSTLSEQLQQRFNISASRTPILYQRMLDRIAALNQIEDVDRIQDGTHLLVPQVPRVGKEYFSVRPEWTGQVVTIGRGLKGKAIEALSSRVLGYRNEAPQIEYQSFFVPRSEAANYVLSGLDEQGVSGPLTVRLAQYAGAVKPASVLTPADAKLLSAKLDVTNGPKPVVVVLDDSFPDNGEYLAAKDYITAMSKRIRSAYGAGSQSYLVSTPGIAAGLTGSQAILYPGAGTHAGMIKHSLKEFVALDKNKRITVLYLPLSATQLEAVPLLKEILFLSEICKTVGRARTGSSLGDDMTRSIKETVDRLVAANPRTFSVSALQALNGLPIFITTDSILLEAVATVLQHDADLTGRPFMLSFSWIKDEPSTTYFPERGYGLKITAAGNHDDSALSANFIERELDYAARATGKSFIAVMNSTGGTQCPSNTYDDKGIDVLSVSFPGDVLQGFCGTSFSTPRVAWLLAAREAALGKVLPAPLKVAPKVQWQERQLTLIRSFRQPAGADLFQRYALSVDQLFKSP